MAENRSWGPKRGIKGAMPVTTRRDQEPRAGAERRLGRRLRSEESGWTLIELLISIGLLAVVMGAILGLLDVTWKLQPQDQERGNAMTSAQTGVFRMTRELRTAYKINAIGALTMDVQIARNGTTKRVVYDCNGVSSYNPAWHQCVRTETGGATTVPTVSVVDRVMNATVFSCSPSPCSTTSKYVSVHVEVPAQGQRKKGINNRIEFDDGIYLRNLG